MLYCQLKKHVPDLKYWLSTYLDERMRKVRDLLLPLSLRTKEITQHCLALLRLHNLDTVHQSQRILGKPEFRLLTEGLWATDRAPEVVSIKETHDKQQLNVVIDFTNGPHDDMRICLGCASLCDGCLLCGVDCIWSLFEA